MRKFLLLLFVLPVLAYSQNPELEMDSVSVIKYTKHLSDIIDDEAQTESFQKADRYSIEYTFSNNTSIEYKFSRIKTDQNYIYRFSRIEGSKDNLLLLWNYLKSQYRIETSFDINKDDTDLFIYGDK